MPPSHTSSDLRRQLAERVAQLEREIALASKLTDTETAGVGDQKDLADAASRSKLSEAEIERDRAELRQIALACQRIDEGLYGVCTDCGLDIPQQRLEALVSALRCVTCQQKAERKASASG